MSWMDFVNLNCVFAIEKEKIDIFIFKNSLFLFNFFRENNIEFNERHKEIYTQYRRNYKKY